MAKEESLFGNLDEFTQWKKEWQGMPEFTKEELKPFKTIYLHFNSQKDIDTFSELIGQRVTTETKFLWYPKIVIKKAFDKLWIDKEEKLDE